MYYVNICIFCVWNLDAIIKELHLTLHIGKGFLPRAVYSVRHSGSLTPFHVFYENVWDRISCRINWLQTLYGAEDDLELIFLLPPKVWAAMLNLQSAGDHAWVWRMPGKWSNSAASSALAVLSHELQSITYPPILPYHPATYITVKL